MNIFRKFNGTGFKFDADDIRGRAGRAFDRCYYPRGFGRHMMAVLADGSRTKRLAGVQVPTLAIHGSNDPLIPPRAGRAVARAVPGGRFKLVKGMGHSMPAGSWPVLVDAIAEHVKRVA